MRAVLSQLCSHHKCGKYWRYRYGLWMRQGEMVETCHQAGRRGEQLAE